MEELGKVCVDARVDDLCRGDLTFGPDPYQWEINDDHTPMWLCSHHQYERAQEI